jgi:Mg2+ and Co2+ transporter CorA
MTAKIKIILKNFNFFIFFENSSKILFQTIITKSILTLQKKKIHQPLLIIKKYAIIKKELIKQEVMPRYKKISAKIQELLLPGSKNSSIRWLNIVSPGKEELDFLRKLKKYDFSFRQLRAASSASKADRPILEKLDKYLFLILHFPEFRNNEVIPAEIDFFLSHNLLITLHNGQLKGFNDFFNTSKKDGGSLNVKKYPSAAVLLAEILDKLLKDCYDLMDKNNARINEIEKMIFAGEQKRSVTRILEIEHNIINIRRIMLSHKDVLKKMIDMKSSVLPAATLKNFYIELIEHTKKIWELSEGQKETIDALRNANETLLDYKTNNIIKNLDNCFCCFYTPHFYCSLVYNEY